MHVTLALGRWRQEGQELKVGPWLHSIETSLGYTATVTKFLKRRKKREEGERKVPRIQRVPHRFK